MRVWKLLGATQAAYDYYQTLQTTLTVTVNDSTFLHSIYTIILLFVPYTLSEGSTKKKKLMSLLSYPSRFRPFRLPHHFVQSSLYAALPASATIQFPWASWNFTKLVDSPGEGWVLPYKRLIGMCRWMRSHFHNRSDYNGVAFSIDLLEWDRKFSDFWGK